MKNTETLIPELNHRFADPKNDAAFKKLFVDHLDLTKSFLNATLRLEGERRIKKVQKLPTEQLPMTTGAKKSGLDVLCTDESGTQYIIEVQNRYMKSYFKRVQYYVSHAYAKQLKKGEKYKTLKPITLLSLSDHNLFSDSIDYLSFHHNAEETTRNRYLNDHTYVFIELPKFKKKEAELKTAEDYWIYMIKSAGTLSDIPQQAPKEVKKAYHILETHNWTESELQAYENARKIELDDEDAIETAKEEGEKVGLEKGLEKGKKEGKEEGLEIGLEIGLEKGRREEKVELAKNMRSMGYKTDEIAKITGLPSNEIDNL